MITGRGRDKHGGVDEEKYIHALSEHEDPMVALSLSPKNATVLQPIKNSPKVRDKVATAIKEVSSEDEDSLIAVSYEPSS